MPMAIAPGLRPPGSGSHCGGARWLLWHELRAWKAFLNAIKCPTLRARRQTNRILWRAFFTGHHRASLGITGNHWASPGITGHRWFGRMVSLDQTNDHEPSTRQSESRRPTSQHDTTIILTPIRKPTLTRGRYAYHIYSSNWSIPRSSLRMDTEPVDPMANATATDIPSWDDEDEVTMAAPEGAGNLGAQSLRDAQLEEERDKLKKRAEKFGIEYKEPSSAKVPTSVPLQ